MRFHLSIPLPGDVVDGAVRAEVARTLRHVAEELEGGRDDLRLVDYNGAPAGRARFLLSANDVIDVGERVTGVRWPATPADQAATVTDDEFNAAHCQTGWIAWPEGGDPNDPVAKESILSNLRGIMADDYGPDVVVWERGVCPCDVCADEREADGVTA